MDLFESIDNAIDNLLAEKPSPQKEIEPDPMEDMGEELRAAIAEENVRPVVSLAGTLDRCRRAHGLAALWGSIGYLRSVDNAKPREETTRAMRSLLETKRGTIRKRLNKAEKVRLHDLSARLSEAEADAEDEMAAFIEAFQGVPNLETGDIAALFGAGIWRASQLTGAPADEVARLSGIAPEKIQALQRVLGSP